jgi:diguanylate cyclase (GGDEF)-like protein
MTTAAALSAESRREVRRIVFVSRLAGAIIAAALATGSVAVHWGQLSSRASVSQLATVVVGLGAFVMISTLTRMGHARVLERSLAEVHSLTGRLRDLAERDPLTNLHNMRAFFEALDGAIDQARVTRTEVSLIVADLDNFKALNDAFGHQYGDRVLVATADVFASSGAAGARAARLGGDEFALLLPGSSRADAVELARGIEAALRNVRIDEHQPPTLGSFGVGTYPHDAETAQLLFAAADGRMYGEKHSRKSESLSALSRASWRLFVRAGQAIRPGRTTDDLLQDIAEAARQEFALSACVMRLGGQEAVRHVAVAVDRPELEPALRRLAAAGSLSAATIAAEMPADAWLIGQPMGGSNGESGLVLLAGRPQTAFRPDPSVVGALVDLVEQIVAEGGARNVASAADRDAARAA